MEIGFQKGRTERRRAEMKRGGLRIALEKVRRKRLCCLPPVRSSGFVFSLLNRIFHFSVI